MSTDWLGAYTRYARTFGDIVAYRLGPLRSVLVSDPATIEELLVARAGELRKSSIQHLVRPLIGNGTLLLEGEPWRRRRRLVAPAFHRQRVSLYADTIVRLAGEMVNEFEDGEVRNVYQDVTRLALRVVSRTLFETDVDSVLTDVERALETAARALMARLDARVPLPNWIPAPAVVRLRRARRALDMVVNRFIALRHERGMGSDLISLLLATRDAESGLPLTHEQVRDEAVTIFMAGFETTAISLAWTFWLLAQHPRVASHLKAELDRALQGRPATNEDMTRLSSVENVVNEVMRLYPPAWIMGRQALADMRVGEYTIPRGWNIEFSQWVVHRDPRIWPNADEFDPTRWAHGLSARLPRFAYFPFGGGPRVCIGNALAKMEVMLVLATVAAEITFEPVDGASVIPDPGFTLRPASAMPLRARRHTPRRPSSRRGMP